MMPRPHGRQAHRQRGDGRSDFRAAPKTDEAPAHQRSPSGAQHQCDLTSAPEYAADGIFRERGRYGWVTSRIGAPLRRKQRVHDFQPPLDIVDGAATHLRPLLFRPSDRQSRVGQVPQGLCPHAVVTTTRPPGARKQSRRTRRPRRFRLEFRPLRAVARMPGKTASVNTCRTCRR